MANLPDNQIEITVDSNSKSEEDDAVDPRVQIELERLNHANEAINHLELQLDEARKTLKEFCNTSENKLLQLEKSIGTAVLKARSYYDTRIKFRNAKEILTKAKHRFERAQALHLAAKELAIVSTDQIEQAKKLNQNFQTWDETLHQAIEKTEDAQREKYQADLDQQYAEKIYFELENLVEKLQKDFRRSINKSKPYYEMQVEYHKELDFQKRKVYDLENCVNEAKNQYQESLRNLERISNEIHEQRNPGILKRKLQERTSHIDKEQINYIKPKLSPSTSVLVDGILRTESLPTEIFMNTDNRYLSDNDEITKISNDFHDQFILCSKEASKPIIRINSEDDTKSLTNSEHERFSSFSSQLTDDETNSLNILSDEQLNHLPSIYHPYSSDLSLQEGTRGNIYKQSDTFISESMLY